jgi:exodeoxyribonuclease VII large subunit
VLNTDLKNQILTVSQFNQLIDEILSPLQVIVEGELSGINTNSGRWFFATLKDNEASVGLFAPLGRISNWQVLQEGMRVRVDGWPRLYQKTGRFSLFARSILPAGKGALKEAYEKLKRDLEALGYFDPARKRPLPPFIRRIGLISAPDSRAYSDFVTILNSLSSGIRVDFYPVLVQGNQAIDKIRSAFNFFNCHPDRYDLLVLTRGGGSLEDLLPFNSRVLAEVVYGSQIPVLAAIGHEKDENLIDLVADIRAATPTAAAQTINSCQQQFLLVIGQLAEEIIRGYQESVLSGGEQLGNLVNNLFFYYQRQFQRADLLFTRLREATSRLSGQVAFERKNLISLTKLLASFDYRNVLRRGFTLTINNRGKIITASNQVLLGDRIMTRLYRGEIVSLVKQKNG